MSIVPFLETTLSLEQATFTFTGNNVVFGYWPPVTVVPATVAVTGQDVGLRWADKRLTADYASYAMSGEALSLFTDRKLSGSVETFSVSGQDVSWSRIYIFSPDFASYQTVGTETALSAVLIIHHFDMAALPAEYGANGQNTNFVRELLASAEVQSYSVAGLDAAILIDMHVTQGSISVNANDASLMYSRIMPADYCSVALSQENVGLAWYVPAAYVMGCITATYDLSGIDALPKFDVDITYNATVLSGQDAGTYIGYKVITDYAQFALAGQSANIVADYTIAADQANLYLSGKVAGLTYVNIVGNSYTIQIGHSHVDTYGQEATLAKGYLFSADAAQFTATGKDASLSRVWHIDPERGEIAVSNEVATLKAGWVFSTDPGVLTVNGQDLTLDRVFTLVTATGNYTINLKPAFLQPNYLLPQGAGRLSAGRTVVIG